MTEYFVFCYYDPNWISRAVMIPYDQHHKDDITVSDDELIVVVDNQSHPQDGFINAILGLGNKIVACYQQDGNLSTHIGYIINGKFDNSKRTSAIIQYWETMLHIVDHDHEGLMADSYLIYTPNQENRACSPSELYDEIISLNIVQSQCINVKQCVMVSSVDFNQVERLQLRFFPLYKKDNVITYSCQEIETLLMKTNKFCSVICTSDCSKKFAGYGYVELNNKDDYVTFFEKKLTIDDQSFFFD